MQICHHLSFLQSQSNLWIAGHVTQVCPEYNRWMGSLIHIGYDGMLTKFIDLFSVIQWSYMNSVSADSENDTLRIGLTVKNISMMLITLGCDFYQAFLCSLIQSDYDHHYRSSCQCLTSASGIWDKFIFKCSIFLIYHFCLHWHWCQTDWQHWQSRSCQYASLSILNTESSMSIRHARTS